MTSFKKKTCVLILLAWLLPSFATAETLETGKELPTIEGKSLTDTSVTLPSGAAQKSFFLVLTFRKTASNAARLWSERFLKDDPDVRNIQYFNCMFLEDVPRLFRGFVSSGIKKGIPERLYPVTLRVYQDQKRWEELLSVTDRDAPYLILVDSHAKIAWLNHGALSPELYREFQEALKKVSQTTP